MERPHVIALLAFCTACAEPTGDPIGEPGVYDGYALDGDPYLGYEPQGTPPEFRIVVETDPAVLQQRVSWSSASLPMLPWGGTAARGASEARGGEDPVLRLVGGIRPPTVPGHGPEDTGDCDESHESHGDLDDYELQANAVVVAGDLAFVSYHRAGDVVAGAVDVVDITDPERPTLRSSAWFTHLDLTGVSWVPSAEDGDSGMLYVAATTCDPCYAPYTALVEHISVTDGVLDIESDWRFGVPGLATVAVVATGNTFMAATGEVGGVTLWSETEQRRLAWSGQRDLRWVDGDGSVVAALTGAAGGESAALHLLAEGSLEEIDQFAIDGLEQPLAHATVDLEGSVAWIAAGQAGLRAVDLRDGRTPGVLELPQDTGYDPEDVATNAVASHDSGLLFLSNGGLGLGLVRATPPATELAPEQEMTLEPIGRVDLTGSANHLAVAGSMLLVAAGADGLQVIAVEDGPAAAR